MSVVIALSSFPFPTPSHAARTSHLSRMLKILIRGLGLAHDRGVYAREARGERFC